MNRLETCGFWPGEFSSSPSHMPWIRLNESTNKSNEIGLPLGRYHVDELKSIGSPISILVNLYGEAYGEIRLIADGDRLMNEYR